MSDINAEEKTAHLKDRDGDGVIDLPPLGDFRPHGISPEKKEELDRLFGEIEGEAD